MMVPDFSLVVICLMLSVTLTVIAPFIDVPSGIKRGTLRYYSPYLIAESPKQNTINIHGGTLFDYFYSFDPACDGKARKRQVTVGYVDGLLNLLQHHENDEIDYRLRATSYIISENTARKIGFSRTPTDPVGRAIVYFNYVNLLCSYSLMQGKPSLLRIKQVQTFESSIQTLSLNKYKLLQLKKRLAT